MSRYFLTTAIDYANGDPHIGHAYEKMGTDAIARYRRLRGDDVWFLIGMDEHGQKVAQTAAEQGTTPAELVDSLADRFQAMWRELGITHDQFIRTTDPAHRAGVKELIERIFERNPDDFYERAYSGQYCVGCEAFKQDAEIVDGHCVLHPTRTLEWVEETNWFFRLSKYQQFLQDLHQSRPDFLQPESKRNEILGLLDQGLEDISASRARLTWGVPFPRPVSSGETQITYVWFDALPNYWTATRFPGSRAEWPAQLHVVGKDINRFHAVIWPAMLEAAGLPLPERVWVHGFVQFRGERFSKSAGARLDLREAVDRFGADALRYFLLREVPWDSDGNFSWERFEERYNAELADGLGNLAARSLTMLSKYRDGIVPEGGPTELDQRGLEAIDQYVAAMDRLDLRGGADAAWELVTAANLFVQQRAPWSLAKAGRDAELDEVLGALARCLYRLAILASPFLPRTSERLFESVGGQGNASAAPWDSLVKPVLSGALTSVPSILFPKPETVS